MIKKSTVPIPKTPLRFLWHLGSKYKILGAFVFLLVLLAETLNVLIFYVSSQLIDVFTSAQTLTDQKEALMMWGGIFLAVTFGNSICYRLSGFALITWVIKFHRDGYAELYEYLTRHSHTYFSNRFAGALSNKVSNAVDSSAGMMFQIVWTFFSELIGLLVTMILFFTIDIRIGLVLLVMFFVVLGFNVWAVRRRRPLVVAYATASSKARGEGVDTITNMSIVRQFSQRGFELHRLNKVFDDRAEKDIKQSIFGEWILTINTFFALFMTTTVLIMLFVLLDTGAITAGVLVLVLGLLGRVGYMFTVIGQALNRFIREYGNVEEGLKEILQETELTDQPGAKELLVSKGEIIWNDVTFEYGPNNIFKHFNLTISPGQRLGLVGPSGAGKSTFVSLLLRQNDVDGGSITIDDQAIDAVTQDSLRKNIAIVPQEPALFHRTIRENIAYGKPEATEAEIIEAATRAQAHEFIMHLEKGYDTLVGERGVKLSGGQKQRVAIARAMLKNAPILVLDEATSALDSESEVAIQTALSELMSGKTVIAIAHRLSTLREMDRILVLEQGQIVEDGTHDSLKQAGGVYQRLWEHQAGGFMSE